MKTIYGMLGCNQYEMYSARALGGVLSDKQNSHLSKEWHMCLSRVKIICTWNQYLEHFGYITLSRLSLDIIQCGEIGMEFCP